MGFKKPWPYLTLLVLFALNKIKWNKKWVKVAPHCSASEAEVQGPEGLFWTYYICPGIPGMSVNFVSGVFQTGKCANLCDEFKRTWVNISDVDQPTGMQQSVFYSWFHTLVAVWWFSFELEQKQSCLLFHSFYELKNNMNKPGQNVKMFLMHRDMRNRLTSDENNPRLRWWKKMMRAFTCSSIIC